MNVWWHILTTRDRKDSRFSTLLVIVNISAVQSFAQTFIHNAILFIDTSNNAWHNQAHWLIGTPYLSTIGSKDFPRQNNNPKFKGISWTELFILWNRSQDSHTPFNGKRIEIPKCTHILKERDCLKVINVSFKLASSISG